jgi:hypothetical protein
VQWKCFIELLRSGRMSKATRTAKFLICRLFFHSCVCSQILPRGTQDVLQGNCWYLFFFFFFGEGPRSRCYWRTAALRLLVQPCDEDEKWCFIFTSNGAPVELNWQGKTEVLGEKPVPVPLCPPQIPYGLTRDRTRASAVEGRRLTAWAMARPNDELQFSEFLHK